MKERPMLFSAPMVRAILDGRKTVTRRIVKPVKFYPDFGCAVGQVGGVWRYGSPAALGLRERGDHWSVVLKGDVLQRMCTSEAYGWGAGAGCPYGVPGDRLWVRETFGHFERNENFAPGCEVFYRADGESLALEPWRPSIHMPRWASRITLEVTSVRVERLRACNEVDAIAEGAPWAACGAPQEGSHKAGFAQLWEQINGRGSWEANPFVWVVNFRRIDHA